MYYPSKGDFVSAAEEGKMASVYRDVLGDMETPISVYCRFCQEPYSYLLESVEGNLAVARYSFIGREPIVIFKSRGEVIELIERGVTQQLRGNPIILMRQILQGYRPSVMPDTLHSYAKAVGYLSYDIVRFIERLPDKAVDDLGLPESVFVVAGTVIVFDHLKNVMRIVSNVRIGKNPGEDYDTATARIEQIIEALRKKPILQKRELRRKTAAVVSNMTRESFMEAVRRAKAHIEAGDIFQVVLSQRLQTSIYAEPFEVYRALRMLNPSPYMFYLNYGCPRLIGASPELLVKLQKDLVQTRPIAGTRPRGKTAAEDQQLLEELKQDEKERAEHVMLVDLGRNDLGKVCRYGSIVVDDFMSVETYSHVMHLVSNVSGKIQEDCDAFDALIACFPAGTVSGAPKVRAMEIIEELEPNRRGPYAGAVGYFDLEGNMDTCITIRTIVVVNGKAYVQAGAGIVADSEPEREYEETLHKARALIRALEIAEGGLP